MKPKFEHLVRNVPNTKKNRDFIKSINKMSKDSESNYRLYIKYRKPKEGKCFSAGGGLKREDANAFSVYIDDRRPYGERPIDEVSHRAYKYSREVNRLKSKLDKIRSLIDELDYFIGGIEDECAY